MYVAFAVDVVRHQQDLSHIDTTQIFLDWTTLYQLQQLATCANFHDNILAEVVSKVLVERDDVRVIQVLVDADLVFENEFLVRVETVPGNYFDGALRASLPVDAESDVGVGSTSDDLPNSVDLSNFGVVLHDEVVRLDEDIFNPRDHLILVRILFI